MIWDWDEANRLHLKRHSVSPEEAQEVILDADAIFLEIQFDTGEERTKALGMTRSGRMLEVVFTFRNEALRPITAYPASKRLQDLYFTKKVK